MNLHNRNIFYDIKCFNCCITAYNIILGYAVQYNNFKRKIKYNILEKLTNLEEKIKFSHDFYR